MEDARGRITDGDDGEGDESALDSKHKGGSLLETERALRDGLAAWEELGEGLTGVRLCVVRRCLFLTVQG